MSVQPIHPHHRLPHIEVPKHPVWPILSAKEKDAIKGRIKDLGLVAEGFVLNRSYAGRQDLEPPHDARERLAAGGETDAHLLDALEKLAPLANGEAVRIESDRKLLDELEREGLRDGGHGAMALPFLDEVVDDLPALNVLSEAILVAK